MDLGLMEVGEVWSTILFGFTELEGHFEFYGIDMINIDFYESFELLQRNFYDRPSVPLSNWIVTSDETGHIVISLLNNFVNQNCTKRTTLQIRNHDAYRQISILVQLEPWNSFFEYVEGAQHVKIRNSISDAELSQIADLINQHHRAFE